ncbi:MAG: hypothetical protein ACW9W3_01035 [Candidatus Nitrosopumilus sp. bin_68KS]
MNLTKQSALIKIFIMLGVIFTGGTVIIIGYSIYVQEPFIVTNDPFDDDIQLNSNYAELVINFHAQGGFFPDRNVDPFIQITLHEQIINSSDIKVTFFDGDIIKIVDRKQLSIQNDPVHLKFHDTAIQVGTNVSRYVAEPYLSYDSPGEKGAEIHIEMEDGSETFEKTWIDVIEIKSREDYLNQKNKNEDLGIALIILGIALITTASTFAKVFEYYEEL